MGKTIKTKQHYIAYFDVLGYRQLIETDNSFLERINNAMLSVMSNFKLMQDFLALVLTKPKVKIKVFSDNAVIFVEVTGNNQIDIINLSILLYCVKKIQLDLIANAQVFLRGAITKGEMFSNSTYIYGKGLIKAFELEKDTAKHPRIIIDNCVLDDTNRVQFDPLEKMDFLTYQVVENKEKFSKKVEKFSTRRFSPVREEFFFDDLLSFGIFEFFYSVELNGLDNFSFESVKSIIVSLTSGLEKFFTKNISCYVTDSDGISFLDYLESTCVNPHRPLYLTKEKEAYSTQVRLIRNYDTDTSRIKEKYEWLKEYHNRVARDIGADIYGNLFIE